VDGQINEIAPLHDAWGSLWGFWGFMLLGVFRNENLLVRLQRVLISGFGFGTFSHRISAARSEEP
jgi:hypothetical protein